jgi:MFS family permease
MTSDARVLLREGPMTFFQVMVVVICTVLNMIDGFDVLAMSFTAPLIAKEWGVGPEALGALLSAGLAGMALGSLALSPLADLFGRRTILFLSTAIISIGMLASAVTSDVLELALCRFLTGLGVGGLLASGNTLLAEYAPDRWRDLSISAMVVGYSGGAIVGGSISTYLIAEFGWRAAFIFGGACSTVLLPAVLYLPESLDFIIAKNGPRALTQVNAVLRRLGYPPTSVMPAASHDEKTTKAVLGVFEQRFLKGTLLICISYFMLMLSFYFVLSWTPKKSCRPWLQRSAGHLRFGAAERWRYPGWPDVRLLRGKVECAQACALYVCRAVRVDYRIRRAAHGFCAGDDRCLHRRISS